MLIIGFAGGLDPVHPSSDPITDYRVVPTPYWYHDAAAVLLEDGAVVAAVEQERIDRIKHSNRFPGLAIERCLALGGAHFEDVDRFVYYNQEARTDMIIGRFMLQHPQVKPLWTARAMLHEAFRRHFGKALAPDRLCFVEHHLAHAVSAYAMSSFREALVVTIDGQGDALSGTVFEGKNGSLERLMQFPETNSIGNFYTNVIGFLGYSLFDEYKVMGLAPYGDPARYRDLFRQLYTLYDDGAYAIHADRLPLLATVGLPRRTGEPFTQIHKDLAAALQDAVETMVLHLLRHYQRRTGLRRLCLAGGVAHNCTMGGKLLQAGLFDDIFVQPASYDAGCALGAALAVHQELCPKLSITPLAHVYWGTHAGSDDEIRAHLEPWRALVDIEALEDTPRQVATLLAEGAAIGWVQGRSEFGPRALGNRSILADPRPLDNRDLINAMVKKREAYRPFAPAVIEERAHDFFDIPEGTRLPFMLFAVPVREHMRARLQAITHIDGTARVQTVSRQQNARFHDLVHAFGELTGIPILLNTSFNNNAEPIVDSVEDAVVCFLATGLNYLVVGDYLVRRRQVDRTALLDLVPTLPPHLRVSRSRQWVPEQGWQWIHTCTSHVAPRYDARLSEALYELLTRADDQATLAELARQTSRADDPAALLAELETLWARHIVVLRPRMA